MHIRDLDGKNVCILGFGKEGRAMAMALEKYAPKATITIADANPDFAYSAFRMQSGSEYLQHLDRFDAVIQSPGIKPCAELEMIHDCLTSGTQIFLDTVAQAGATVIGVTGSKGKSTTSTLIYEVLKAAGKKTFLAGNIGKPAIACLDEAAADTIFVLEMSSYQLMHLTTSPAIAVITSFFPEHLDYHGSLEAYKEAKKHIARFQRKDGIVFYNGDSAQAKEIAEESIGKKIPFTAHDAPVSLGEIQLIGRHNLSNIAAAFKVAEHFGVSAETAINVFRNFTGLPHRLQSLGVHQGIEWVDDAISTTPESAVAALDALGDRVRTIILGGQDRGSDFSELAQRIAASQVQTVILFPGSGPRIREAIGNAQADICFQEAQSMEKAVLLGRQHTMTGAICLLSTASPSYGMFKNFEEKGEQFKKYIEELVS